MILVFLVFGLLIPAAAHRQEVLDPNDTSGPLDIQVTRNNDRRMFVASTHGGPNYRYRELIFRISTFEDWAASILKGEFNFIAIEIERKGHEGGFGGDLCFYIEPRGENYLQGRMYTKCWPSPEEPKGDWRNVLRPDTRSARAVFPRRLIGRDTKVYRWRFGTSFEENGHSECEPSESPPPEKVYGTCADYTEWREHRL